MPEPESPRKLPPSAENMIRQVGVRRERLERRMAQKNDAWNSIGLLGVVGWSVTVPTLLGVLLGVWIDHHWPSRFSWTLTLLITGLVVGCTNAWLRIGPGIGRKPR